jgi:hypothetical protein
MIKKILACALFRFTNATTWVGEGSVDVTP